MLGFTSDLIEMQPGSCISVIFLYNRFALQHTMYHINCNTIYCKNFSGKGLSCVFQLIYTNDEAKCWQNLKVALGLGKEFTW